MNKYIVGFKRKSETLNTFFAEQCSLRPNKSVLPSQLTLLTKNSLSKCNFSKKDILQINRNLDFNKAHGHDMISIRMLILCGDSIRKALELILKTYLRNGRFSQEWKKANAVPVHKKGDKQTIKSYRPVSLLPVCGKILERLLYDTMFNFFYKNNLPSPNQSTFRPGYSCINQLLSINHEILSAFDMGLEVREIFLDISKAFDKVRHDGMIFKLHQNGIFGEMINILMDFLSDRKQRVVLNGQCSSWADIRAGVPQGSILGPLFLIYINDLSNDIKSKCKLFADDAPLFSVVHDIDTSANDLNHDLEKISEWVFQWKMRFNTDPSKHAQEIIFRRKKTVSIHPVVYFNNTPVNSTATHKYLGMILDSKRSYENHQDHWSFEKISTYSSNKKISSDNL